MLADEFRSAIIVPVTIRMQPTASVIGTEIRANVELGPEVTVQALVDTGATASAIVPSALKGLKWKRVPRGAKKMVATLIGGVQIRGVGKFWVQAEDGPELPMQVGVFDLSLLMSGNKDIQMLLGLDYLCAAMARIDCAWKKLRCGMEMVPMRSTQELRSTLVYTANPPDQPTSPGSRPAKPGMISVEMTEEEARVMGKLAARFTALRPEEKAEHGGLKEPAEIITDFVRDLAKKL